MSDKYQPRLNRGQNGQVLLIVVLVMVVGLTVALSLASRSIVSLRTSEEEITSQQALSAAEAGIEQVSKTSVEITNGTFEDDTTYNASITQVSGNSFLVNGGNAILKNDSADIWLSEYSKDSEKLYANPWSGTLSIYWGKGNDGCAQAALEIIVLSGTRANPTSKKYALDPCADRRGSNSFSEPSVGGGAGEKTFPFKTEISVENGLIARVVPLYRETPIGVFAIGVPATSALPSQGQVITSTGKSGTTSRKVTVFQGYPTLPSEYFPYGLFVP